MDINAMISKMTLEQKVKVITGRDNASTNEIEELNIPSLYMTDGANGVRIWDSNESTICYPTSSAVSATFNKELTYKLGEYLGDECNEKNVDMLLSPGINIKRNPLCGRNFEYYSEDVCLNSEIGGAFVEGLQSTGVGACVKHFAGYNDENGAIYGVNNEIDERTLREIYLKSFENIIKKSKPSAIMCSYNRLNGVYSSENKYLFKEVLKDEWKFEGLTVSDWGSIHNRINSISAGLDLEMPNTTSDRYKEIKLAIEENRLTMEELDACVKNMLKFIDNRLKNKKKVIYNNENRKQLALEIAEESITLLKNDKNILPINKDIKQKITIIGEFSKKPAYQGGGCAHVANEKASNPYDEIKLLAGDNIELDYIKGFDVSNMLLDGFELMAVMEKAKKSDKILFFIGNPYNKERETFDRSDLTFENNMLQILDCTLRQNSNVIVIVEAGSAVDMRLFKNKAKAIIMQWYSGEMGAKALAKIIFGEVNPSGKLGETFPLDLADVPSYKHLREYDDVIEYKEGIFVGYTYYERNNIPTLYEFGYGLSYTKFEYTNLKINETNEKFYISFDIKNIGNCYGKEICQLYVAPLEFKCVRQNKLLKRFDKISLEVNEKKTIEFVLTKEDFEVYNTSNHCFHSYSGGYNILIGSSSKSIILKGEINYLNSNDLT